MTGPSHFLKGFTLLTRPGIRAWVIIPLLINILLFVGITLIAIEQFNGLLSGLTDWLPDWLGFIVWLVWALFALLLLLVYGYTFAIIANLIASPFYGLLAERTQRVLTGTINEQPLTWQGARLIAGRAFVRELRKLLYFTPRIVAVLLLCLVLSLIPGLNLLSPFIAFLWGAWSLSLQYLDYPADNNQVTFDKLREEVKKKRQLTTTFGGLVLLGTSIPLVNLLVLPAAVTGATSLWLREFATQNPAPVLTEPAD